MYDVSLMVCQQSGSVNYVSKAMVDIYLEEVEPDNNTPTGGLLTVFPTSGQEKLSAQSKTSKSLTVRTADDSALGGRPDSLSILIPSSTKAGDTSYLDAWQKLEAGVDTKAPLSDFYDAEVLKAVQEAPDTFNRWGLPQGQGALVGAMQGPLPVPKALSDLINGKGDATAAAQSAQKAVEDLQKDIN